MAILNKKDIFNNDFFQKLNSLKLAVNLRSDSQMAGSRKSRQKGNSVEFSDFREYNLGDDIRRIDWNAYGRFNKLYVKQFMEEKESKFNIFIDTSKSMSYGENKVLYTNWIAGAFSYLVLNNLDRLSLFELGNDYKSLLGLIGTKSFYKSLEWIANLEFNKEVSTSDWIGKINIKGNGTSIIISDFYTKELEEFIKFLKYKNQNIILIHLLAIEEIEIEGLEGTINFIDSEDDNIVKVSMSKTVIKEYKKRLDLHKEELSDICKKYSCKYVFATTKEPIEQLFFEGLRDVYEF